MAALAGRHVHTCFSTLRSTLRASESTASVGTSFCDLRRSLTSFGVTGNDQGFRNALAVRLEPRRMATLKAANHCAMDSPLMSSMQTKVAGTLVGLFWLSKGNGSSRRTTFLEGSKRLVCTFVASGRVGNQPFGVAEVHHIRQLEDDSHSDEYLMRSLDAPIKLEAPIKLLYEMLQKKGFIDEKTKPLPVDHVLRQDDHRIVAWYRSVAIGLLEYYSFCDNLSKVRSIVNYLLRWSAIYTLAKKHKSSSSKIIAKHTKNLLIKKDHEALTAYLTPEEISQYTKTFTIDLDPTPPEEIIDMLFARLVRKELLVERCAVKGCQESHVEMHHFRQIEKAVGKHRVRSAREAQLLQGIKAVQTALHKKHIPLCIRHHDDLQIGKVFIDDLDINVVI